MVKRYSVNTIASQLVMYWRRGDFDGFRDAGLHKMLSDLAEAVDGEAADSAAMLAQLRRNLETA